ncbi:MAG TPA: trypsin-like peptidase domain-containing protein [Gemmatimonadaceae bacterium]|jgi:S1-C subfamily serine protease/pSer/pThr/pTyr-binding forkhead associated (FHA) protein
MAIELRITSGARAGAREVFTKSIIAIGRHPMSDLRLDTEKDLDVSARHAEIRIVGGTATLRDVGSSNGTRVNGQPLVGERALFDGDVIALGGAAGAAIEFRRMAETAVEPVAAAAPRAEAPASRGERPAPRPEPPAPVPAPDAKPVPPRRDTGARIAEAVEMQTGTLRRTLYAFGAAVVIIGLGLAWMSRQNAAADRATIEQLLRELQDQNTAIAQLRGSAGANGLTNEVGRISRERDSLLTVLRAGGDKAAVTQRIAELSAQQTAAGAVSKVDYERIADQNTRAVAFIVVDHGNDHVEGGSGFGVTRDGLIVTNRHVVQGAGDAAPTRIAVQFHGTRRWLPAHVVKVSSSDDLAFLKVDAPGSFPAVMGVAPSGGVRPGAPIAIVGYPLGNETAGMGGSIDTMTARASLTVGTVSKSVPDILQVDAYVAHGSSGSPVFNERGYVVGVVYGGPTEAAGRIVYSVPSDRLIAQLPGEAAGVVRQ